MAEVESNNLIIVSIVSRPFKVLSQPRHLKISGFHKVLLIISKIDKMTIPHPMPALHSLPFSPEKAHHFVHVISNLLTPEECSEIIDSHQNLTPSNVTPETVRMREIFDDEQLAETLWARLRQVYDLSNIDINPTRIFDEYGEPWVLSGLNSRFRLCLYEKGMHPFFLFAEIEPVLTSYIQEVNSHRIQMADVWRQSTSKVS